jgi:hypothetical protein
MLAARPFSRSRHVAGAAAAAPKKHNWWRASLVLSSVDLKLSTSTKIWQPWPRSKKPLPISRYSDHLTHRGRVRSYLDTTMTQFDTSYLRWLFILNHRGTSPHCRTWTTRQGVYNPKLLSQTNAYEKNRIDIRFVSWRTRTKTNKQSDVRFGSVRYGEPTLQRGPNDLLGQHDRIPCSA